MDGFGLVQMVVACLEKRLTFTNARVKVFGLGGQMQKWDIPKRQHKKRQLF